MPDLSVVLGGARATPAQQKLYLEYLSLGRLDVMTSFLPAPWDAAALGGASPTGRRKPRKTSLTWTFPCFGPEIVRSCPERDFTGAESC